CDVRARRGPAQCAVPRRVLRLTAAPRAGPHPAPPPRSCTWAHDQVRRSAFLMNPNSPPAHERRPRLTKGLLTSTTVAAMAAAMVLPLGTAAQADPADTPVVDYEFTQTTGASVPDAGGSEAAVVQNA